MFSFISDIFAGIEGRKHASRVEGFANQAWDRSQPWDVIGPMGGAIFDTEEQEILTALSPEMQGLFDESLADIYTQREHISAYETDPDAAAQAYYDRWEGITEPQRIQQLLQLEERQLAQGMLHSTGGNMREAALRDAQFQDMQKARFGADQQVQGRIDQYRNRGQQNLTNLLAVGQIPHNYGTMGMQQGQIMTDPAFSTAGMLSQASDYRRQANNRSVSGYIGAGTSALALGAQAYGMMGGLDSLPTGGSTFGDFGGSIARYGPYGG